MDFGFALFRDGERLRAAPTFPSSFLSSTLTLGGRPRRFAGFVASSSLRSRDDSSCAALVASSLVRARNAQMFELCHLANVKVRKKHPRLRRIS